MSNTITIELCSEDRARIDRLTEALERRTTQVDDVLTKKAEAQNPTNEIDPVQTALAEALAKAEATVEAPKNATEEAEASTQATTPAEEEKPAEKADAQPEPEKTVTHADVKALYIKLAATGKRESAKAIIMPISATISGIPEGELNGIYKKLVELEG